jgi:hypothetical protein
MASAALDGKIKGFDITHRPPLQVLPVVYWAFNDPTRPVLHGPERGCGPWSVLPLHAQAGPEPFVHRPNFLGVVLQKNNETCGAHR